MVHYPFRFVIISLAAFLATPLHAQSLPLSTLLNQPPGEAATTPNPPLVPILNTPSYGIGVNCPGNWSSAPIQFIDTAPLAHGLGQHPPDVGVSLVTFDLNAIAAAQGRSIVAFSARIGIEHQTSTQNNGAWFTVFVDGSPILVRNIPSRLSPSEVISVPLIGASSLTLQTVHSGNFHSNHACWGLAELTLGNTCDSIDFNNDTSLFDPQDIEAFLSVYSEGPCVPASAICNDIDFNNDTSLFDPCDINSFLVVYSEGPCTPCGS